MQRATFDLDLAWANGGDGSPLVPSGPIGPLDMSVVGSFFIMRELELSFLLWGQVAFDEKARFVRLHLSVSKTDPCGLGCFRKWESVCSASLASPCPYHAMLRQRGRVLATWPAPSGMPHHELPVFPDTGGGHPSKEAVVRTLEAIAEAAGEPQFSGSGARRFGGHSLRIIGAQRLAAMGIPIVIIMRLGRWAGNAVLGYVRDAPLLQLSSLYRKALEQCTGEDDADQLRLAPSSLSQLEAKLGGMAASLAELVTESRACDARLSAIEDLEPAAPSSYKLGAPFVRNKRTDAVHRPGRDGPYIPPSRWASLCGWAFGMERAKFTRLGLIAPSIPFDSLCEKCLPDICALRCPEVLADDDHDMDEL